RPDGDLSLRHLRRLEHHRAHAACGVRRRAAGAEPVRRRRSRALQADLARRVRQAGEMSIQVQRPGLLMTVQDMGRHGHQHVGLCPGGAMDPLALTLANALVGNEHGAAALELTVLGPDLLFERDSLVALVGAEFEADIPINRPVLVPRGARVSISRAARGARAYLAVAGGIQVEVVLGSRSTYIPGGFGGLDGRVLKRGDVVPLAENA